MESLTSIEDTLRGAYGVCFLSPITLHGRMYRAKEHGQKGPKEIWSKENHPSETRRSEAVALRRRSVAAAVTAGASAIRLAIVTAVMTPSKVLIDFG